MLFNMVDGADRGSINNHYHLVDGDVQGCEVVQCGLRDRSSSCKGSLHLNYE